MNKPLHNNSEHGQAFTELAISMVFLLILMAGVIDMGRAIFTYISIRDAVQEGAAYGAIAPTDCEGIKNRILSHTKGAIKLRESDILMSIKIDGTACTSVVPANIDTGDPVYVGITFQNFRIATPFIGTIIGSQVVDFKAEVTDTVLVEP